MSNDGEEKGAAIYRLFCTGNGLLWTQSDAQQAPGLFESGGKRIEI